MEKATKKTNSRCHSGMLVREAGESLVIGNVVWAEYTLPLTAIFSVVSLSPQPPSHFCRRISSMCA
jgi:hypothetical protein